MSRKRKFKVKPTTGPNVKPHPSLQTPPEQRHPHFSLRYISDKKRFCLSSCETNEKAAFAERLYRLSQMTWAQIRQQDRHGLGYEKIPRSALKTKIPDHIKDDVGIVAFRFQGLKAMVGYKIGHVFYIVWLDRLFKLYNHGK